MTIHLDNALPPNVVEIGNEITQGVVDGLMSASPSASSSNPYATVNGISGIYLPLAGGTMTGDIGVNYNDLNQVTSIVFADNTVQTTASSVGVPVGGTAGQVLSKIDETNYNTEWANPINPAEGFTLNNGAYIDGSQGVAVFGTATINTATISGGSATFNGTTNISGQIALGADGYVALESGLNIAYLTPTGLGFQGNANITFSDSSVQTTAFIDAPSDGNQYARKDSNWEQITNGIPVGGMAGQVLSKIDATDYNTQWTNPINPADGFTLNENSVINATSAGNTINIGDQTTQVGTAFNLYNSSFTSYGNINTISNNTYLLNTNVYYLDGLAITGNIGVIAGLNIGQSLINFNSSCNITTSDDGMIISGSSYGNSYVSAFNGVESTGFYFSKNGILTIGNFNDGTNDYGLASTALIKSNVGFQFSDGSIQTTSAISGDRYKTTSTSSNTINNNNGKSFICDTGLSYTPLQTCIIYEPSNPQGLHMHCNVVSYDTSTGELIIDVTSHTGSGTYTNWVINK